MQVHEHELILPLGPLEGVHEPLRYKVGLAVGCRASVVPLEGGNEVCSLSSRGREGDQAVALLAAGRGGEAKETERPGHDAAGDPEAKAHGASDEVDATGNDVEWEGDDLPG